jgi:hypothetical protein
MSRVWPFMTADERMQPKPSPVESEEPQDEPESAYCECDLELTVSELDSGRCASCGKAVIA